MANRIFSDATEDEDQKLISFIKKGAEAQFLEEEGTIEPALFLEFESLTKEKPVLTIIPLHGNPLKQIGKLLGGPLEIAQEASEGGKLIGAAFLSQTICFQGDEDTPEEVMLLLLENKVKEIPKKYLTRAVFLIHYGSKGITATSNDCRHNEDGKLIWGSWEILGGSEETIQGGPAIDFLKKIYNQFT